MTNILLALTFHALRYSWAISRDDIKIFVVSAVSERPRCHLREASHFCISDSSQPMRTDEESFRKKNRCDAVLFVMSGLLGPEYYPLSDSVLTEPMLDRCNRYQRRNARKSMSSSETTAPRQHAFTGPAMPQLPEPTHAERIRTSRR
jgi:hypothetical protein